MRDFLNNVYQMPMVIDGSGGGAGGGPIGIPEDIEIGDVIFTFDFDSYNNDEWIRIDDGDKLLDKVDYPDLWAIYNTGPDTFTIDEIVSSEIIPQYGNLYIFMRAK